MEVLLLTIFASVLLAMAFAVFFVWQARSGACDVERDSLLPLDDGRRGSKRAPGEGGESSGGE